MCFCSFHHLPRPGKQLVDISVANIGHEQHAHILKLVLCVVPFQLRVLRPEKNETVEEHGWVFQLLPDILNPFVEKNILAGGAFVQKTVRLDEGDVQFPASKNPTPLPRLSIGTEI